MLIEPISQSYNEISVDDIFSFPHTFTLDQLSLFSDLTGDKNPIHLDEEFSRNSGFETNLVYGMLSASLFSKLIGMYCPGKNGLYLSQTLDFKKPIYIDEEVIVRGTVTKKFDKFQMLKMKTEIIDQKNIFVSGEASAKFIVNE
ncbi:MaoC family dehydratase [Gammaproteobacteria bacterium]|nr:MaoC family dehydratase [Gammaproteobacteria bacterium]